MIGEVALLPAVLSRVIRFGAGIAALGGVPANGALITNGSTVAAVASMLVREAIISELAVSDDPSPLCQSATTVQSDVVDAPATVWTKNVAPLCAPDPSMLNEVGPVAAEVNVYFLCVPT